MENIFTPHFAPEQSQSETLMRYTDKNPAWLALAGMFLYGLALILLFPGGSEQDSAFHFMCCRDAWHNPRVFVDVWSRPLFTLLFVVPVHLGWTAGKLFSVLIGLGAAWQTWKLAENLGLKKAWLVIPILLAQPAFFLLYADFLTEPLFALVLVCALRCHLLGRIKWGMFLASLLPLARPEGFFLAILWGLWVLWGARSGTGERSWQASLRAVPGTLLLASGVFLWWLAALIISGDPLFIPHTWPKFWNTGMYGEATFFTYAAKSWEFAGPILLLPLVLGLLVCLWRRQWLEIVSAFLLPFALHTIFLVYNLLGEAGFSRYMVSVAPATAVLTLLGLNQLTGLFRLPERISSLATGLILLGSLGISFLYLDQNKGVREFVAIQEMADWLRQNPVPWRRVSWSSGQMCVALDLPGGQHPHLNLQDREGNLAVLRGQESGTLVFWDSYMGMAMYGLSVADIQTAGYQVLRTRHHSLPGVLLRGEILGRKLNWETEMTLLYKP